MIERASDRWLSIVLSVLLHGAVVAVLGYGWWHYERRPQPQAAPAAIPAELVSSSMLNEAPPPRQTPRPEPQALPEPQPLRVFRKTIDHECCRARTRQAAAPLRSRSSRRRQASGVAHGQVLRTLRFPETETGNTRRPTPPSVRFDVPPGRDGARVPAVELMVSTRSNAGQAVLAVAGEIDLYTAPRLQAEFARLLETGVERVVIDMSGVEFCDSTGMNVLLSALKRLRERGGTLEVAGPRPAVRKILQVTGLDSVFTVYEAVPAELLAGEPQN